MLLFLLVVPCLSTCCLNCASYSGSNCAVCDSNYYLYNSLICLDACPSGYTATNGVCVVTSSLVLIDEDFSQITDWTLTTAGTMTTSTGGSFISSSSLNLIPTKYQGFYIHPGAYLLGTSQWIPSPDFTLSAWVLINVDGHVLELTMTASASMRTAVISGQYQQRAYLRQQSSGSTSIYQELDSFSTTYAWELISFDIRQTTSSIVTFTTMLNGASQSSSYTGWEARLPSPYNWSMGCRFGFAFQGFFYHLRIVNGVDSTVLASFSAPSCTFNYYWDGSTCNACGGSCATWPWCVSGTSCSPCYDQTCASCSGFAESECICVSGEIFPNCCQIGCSTTCSAYWDCSTCNVGYYTLGNICLNYCASGSCTSLTASALVDVLFTTFLGTYSGFVTGANPSTYYPFNNPDSDDPMPVLGRGLYFTPATSLNNPSVLLAYTFTIGVWALPSSGSIFSKGSEVNLASDGTFTLQILDKTETAAIVTTASASISGWSFIVITTEFITDATSITTSINNSQYSYTTYLNQIFKDASQATLVIGDLYTGFVYGFKFWNSAVYSFSYEYNSEVCGTDLQFSCLLTCSYDEYFDGACTSCPASCTSGCVSSSSCDVCVSDLCLTCTSFTNTCTSCTNNSTLSSGICISDCYYRCSLCTSVNKADSCTACTSGYYFFNNKCIKQCPTGYSGPSCTLENPLALSLTLETLELGEINSTFIGDSPMNLYPDLDPNDPWPARNRGFYFPAGSYLRTPLVFAPSFSINAWIKMTSPGLLLSKQGLLSISVSPQQSDFALNLSDSSTATVPFNISLSTWYYLTFSVDSSVKIYINLLYSVLHTLSAVFEDSLTADTYIPAQTLGFTGYIYSIQIFSQSNTLGPYHNSTCPLDSLCLSECEIAQDPFTACGACPSYCAHGCYDGKCNLCSDDVCYHCTDYQNCLSCKSNSTSIGSVCQCDAGFFFNTTSEECQECTVGCLVCDGDGCLVCEEVFYLMDAECYSCGEKCLVCEGSCTQCIPNAGVVGNGCQCDVNYGGDNCSRVYLNASLALYDARLVVTFTDILLIDLSALDITVDISCASFTWVLSKLTSAQYSVILTMNSAHPQCLANVNFLTSIYSVNNAKLMQTSVSVVIPESSDYKNSTVTSEYTQIYAQISRYALVAVAALSALSANPAGLWSFINTVQLLCFIPLANIDLPPSILGTLIGFRSYNIFPNLPAYLYHGGETHTFTRATELGFPTSSIILNDGKQASAFVICISLSWILFSLSIFPCWCKFIKEFFQSTLEQYRYSFFLRYGIQNYLDFCIACLLALLSMEFGDYDEKINCILAFISIVIDKQIGLIAVPLSCFIAVKRNQGKIHANVEEYKSLFGTLFYEFNTDEDLATSYFYTFFFIRRLLYACILFGFGSYPIVQLALCTILSLAVIFTQNFFYLASIAPFNEKFLNYSNTLSELGICLFFCMVCMYLFDLDNDTRSNVSTILTVTLNGIMTVQMVASLAIFSRTVYIKYCRKSDNKLEVKVSPESSNLACFDPENEGIKVSERSHVDGEYFQGVASPRIDFKEERTNDIVFKYDQGTIDVIFSSEK